MLPVFDLPVGVLYHQPIDGQAYDVDILSYDVTRLLEQRNQWVTVQLQCAAHAALNGTEPHFARRVIFLQNSDGSSFSTYPVIEYGNDTIILFDPFDS